MTSEEIKREKERAYQRAYRAAHLPRKRELANANRAANLDKSLAQERAYRAANRDRIQSKHREWSQANRDRVDTHKAKYREIRRDMLRAKNRAYSKSNPDVVCAKTMRRIAAQIRAIPPWANSDAIRAVYAEAARMRAETGLRFEVDHIVPLRGRTVCGLHVAHNLQVITKAENIRKSNKLIHDQLYLSAVDTPPVP